MGWFIGILLSIILLIFLFKFPKQTLILIGGIVFLLFLGWYFFIAVPEQEQKELENSVKITLQYDQNTCGNEYPLRVHIYNGSKKTVTKVKWNLNVFVPGYSTEISGYKEYISDKILQPNQEWTSCYTLPKDVLESKNNLSSLEYKTGNWKIVSTSE